MSVKKLKKAQGYISQVKTFFATKWSQQSSWKLHFSVSNDEWYVKIREGMKKCSRTEL